MSDNIKGIPYSTAEFDKEGTLLKEPAVPQGTTDLIMVSHGWNNDREAAELLYRKLFGNFADVTAGDAAVKARRIAIVGIIWPSKKFDDFMTEPASASGAAGGAAAAGGNVNTTASHAAMHEAIDRAAPLFETADAAGRIAALHKLVPELDGDSGKQQEFVETLRKLVEPDGMIAGEHSRNDGSENFFEDSAAVIFERAAKEPVAHPPPGGEVAPKGEGHAAGMLGDLFSGATRAVQSLLNLTTYYEMKKRAGTVGKNGVAPLIDKLAETLDKDTGRIHLVGHSFGGRLVTAAATESTTGRLYSLSLLQAAFSHNGFSQSFNGFFRPMIEKQRVKGPILVTHTKNDTAVGRAYPIASRISGSNAESLGDADDEFGGIGSNGAQRMKDGEIAAATAELLAVNGSYAWQPGKFHNLESSKFIVNPDGGDAHGFIHVPQVAWAISRVIVS